MHIYNSIFLLTQYDFSSSIVVCDTLSLRWRLIHIMHLHACMHLYPFWEMHIYNSSDSVWFLYYAHAQDERSLRDKMKFDLLKMRTEYNWVEYLLPDNLQHWFHKCIKIIIPYLFDLKRPSKYATPSIFFWENSSQRSWYCTIYVTAERWLWDRK